MPQIEKPDDLQLIANFIRLLRMHGNNRESWRADLSIAAFDKRNLLPGTVSQTICSALNVPEVIQRISQLLVSVHVFQVVPKLRIELNIPAFSKTLVDQQDDADVAFASDDASGSLKNVVQARQLIGILKAVEIFFIKVFSELIRFVV